MNDLTKVSDVLTKAIRSIKISNSDGTTELKSVESDGAIDLSVLNSNSGGSTSSGASDGDGTTTTPTEPETPTEPASKYLASGTVLYSTANTEITEGKVITLNGVTDKFDNIENGIEFHFSNQTTTYTTGIISTTTYHLEINSMTFSNGKSLPFKLTKSELVAGTNIPSYMSSSSVQRVSASGSKSSLTPTIATIDPQPINGNAIKFLSDTHILATSNNSVNWILNEIVVL